MVGCISGLGGEVGSSFRLGGGTSSGDVEHADKNVIAKNIIRVKRINFCIEAKLNNKNLF